MANREKARELEDIIMNKFIEEGLDVFDTPGLSGDPKYNELPPDKKEAYDLASFQYFHQAQQAQAEQNSRYGSMEFPNFIKMFLPEEGFQDVLRESDGEGTPAKVWHDIYNQNTNLMKESALKGLRRMISAQM